MKFAFTAAMVVILITRLACTAQKTGQVVNTSGGRCGNQYQTGALFADRTCDVNKYEDSGIPKTMAWAGCDSFGHECQWSIQQEFNCRDGASDRCDKIFNSGVP